MEFESENDVITKLRLSISDWIISEKLRKQLQNNGINNISDIISLPFFILFFYILEFNYNLLVELIISLWEVIPHFRFACSPVNINYFCVADFNDDAKKLDIKTYIHNYIEEHGQFLTDYSNYDEWDELKIYAERLRTASLISELWYTDSLHLLDEYGFDFQAYWRRVNQDGFSLTCETKLFEVIQNNYFPHSIKDISEQSIKSCICNLDISYCWLKHSLWRNLKRSGINTIGELLDYPENEYSKLYRARPLMIDYLKQYVQNLKNFISTI